MEHAPAQRLRVMTAEGEWRRWLPPPRRRPRLLAVVIRWRIEIVLLVGGIAAWRQAGTLAMEIVVGASCLLLAAVPVVRRVSGCAFATVVAPHRVRSGLVQAGVTDRAGSPPWLIWAAPVGRSVHVRVWLRAGTTVSDLRGAVPVLAAACGAAHVEVVQLSYRQDRATIIVVHPRWGLLGR
jgi:hypothetical protein